MKKASEIMKRTDFKSIIIRDAEAAANAEYAGDDIHSKRKLKGAIAGFALTKKENVIEKLTELIHQYHNTAKTAFTDRDDNFWIERTTELSIKWVRDCLAAYDLLDGLHPTAAPTRPATVKTEKVLGLRA